MSFGSVIIMDGLVKESVGTQGLVAVGTKDLEGTRKGRLVAETMH